MWKLKYHLACQNFLQRCTRPLRFLSWVSFFIAWENDNLDMTPTSLSYRIKDAWAMSWKADV